MAESGLFIGWGAPRPGREIASIKVFEEAVARGDGDRYTPVIRRGMLKPGHDGLMPTDAELEDGYADHLIRKYA